MEVVVFGSMNLEMFFRHRHGGDVDNYIVSFVEARLAKAGGLPVAFVRDPHQPLFYDRVRAEILRKSGDRAIYEQKIEGEKRVFRIEDRGTHFVTFHPIPERDSFMVPIVEMVVTDNMVLPPWRC
jgi:hypothetical protein